MRGRNVAGTVHFKHSKKMCAYVWVYSLEQTRTQMLSPGSARSNRPAEDGNIRVLSLGQSRRWMGTSTRARSLEQTGRWEHPPGPVRPNRPEEEDVNMGGVRDLAQVRANTQTKTNKNYQKKWYYYAERGASRRREKQRTREPTQQKQNKTKTKWHNPRKQKEEEENKRKKYKTKRYKKKIQDINGNTLIIQVHRAHNYYR